MSVITDLDGKVHDHKLCQQRLFRGHSQCPGWYMTVQGEKGVKEDEEHLCECQCHADDPENIIETHKAERAQVNEKTRALNDPLYKR